MVSLDVVKPKSRGKKRNRAGVVDCNVDDASSCNVHAPASDAQTLACNDGLSLSVDGKGKGGKGKCKSAALMEAEAGVQSNVNDPSPSAAPRRARANVKRTVKYDSEFQRAVMAGMTIKQSSVPNIGLGAFWEGSDPLPARRRIGVYAGRILKRQPHDCTYLFEISTTKRPKYICARNTRYANWTRYINDPRPSRDANVYFTSDGRVATLRQIKPGEELFIDYGEWYFNTDNFVTAADGVVTPAGSSAEPSAAKNDAVEADGINASDDGTADGDGDGDADADADKPPTLRVIVDDDDSSLDEGS
jgi:hypothetical protein